MLRRYPWALSPDEGGGSGGGDGDGEGKAEAQGGSHEGGSEGDGDGEGKGKGGRMVTLSQKALDRMIDDRFRAAYTRARDEQAEAEEKRLKAMGVKSWDELESRLGDGGEGPKPDDEAVKRAIREAQEAHQKELQKEREAKETLSQKLQRTATRTAVLSEAAAQGAINPEQVFQLMGAQLRYSMDNDRVEVVGPEGYAKIDPQTGEQMTVKGAVAEFLSENLHMQRADARAGAGRGSAEAGADRKFRSHYARSELSGLSPEEKEHVSNGLDAGTVTIDDGR